MTPRHASGHAPEPAPAAGWTRRDFLQRATGSGFAAAVLPVAAETIRTGTDGLRAGPIRLDVPGGPIGAYRALPAGARRAPVVLVVSEIFGLHEHIADVCRRFAHAGYYAIAPDLFVRQGDPAQYSDIPRLIAEVVSKTPDAQVMADLDAAAAAARAEGGDTERLGITGFCWGGRITWLYAAHAADRGAPIRPRAAVAWYGKLVAPVTPQNPRHPIDVAAELRTPVLGLYGGQDTGIPLETVEQMKARLAQGSAAARASRFVVYPDAPHAFHGDYRPSYRADAAQDGWRRCLEWLKTHGV